MSRIIYFIANCIYKFFYSVPIKKNRIVLECEYGKGFYGNLLYIYKEVLARKLNVEIIIPLNRNVEFSYEKGTNVRIIRTRSIKHLYYLATSKYWITDNHYYFFLKPRKQTIFVNTWHALGAFKKFGLDSAKNINEVRRFKKEGNNIDYLMVSSENLKPIYSRALNVPIDKILSIGIPRTDLLFEHTKHFSIKEHFFKQYSNLKGKKIILYAPTFRDHEKQKFNMRLDFLQLHKHLGEHYVFLIKLHPIVAKTYQVPQSLEKYVIDVQNEDINELMIVSDILITDYSSVIFEYSLLQKPIIIYAYDFKIYEQQLRGFYYKFESFVPGPIAYTTKDVTDIIMNNKFNVEKVRQFSMEFCEHQDGESTNRFIDKFLS